MVEHNGGAPGSGGNGRPQTGQNRGTVAGLPLTDGRGDVSLQRIVEIAARVTGTRKSFITLAEGEILHVAAAVGSDVRQTETAKSVCGVAYCGKIPLIVPDLSKDPRFAHYPYVMPEDGNRFYAGFPIRSGRGTALGTLCVIDPAVRPEGLTSDQHAVMEALTALCVRVFEGMKRDARLSDYLDIASDWIWEQDTAYRFTFLSGSDDGARARFHDLLGKTRWDSVIGNGESEAFWARHKADLDDRKSFRDLRFRWHDGDVERVHSISGRPVFGRSGVFLGYRGSARDVTAEEVVRRQIEALAHRDPLTGLANRRRFEQRVADTFRDWQETGRSATVFVLDVDNFKLVNDTHGHSCGDELLIEIARRLKACVGENASVARLGGDEFAILEPNLARDGAIPEYAAAIAQAVGAPFEAGPEIVECGCSIGIAVLPDHGASFGQIMGNADLALYQSKSLGRARFTIFDMEMRRDADTRNTLTRELGEAIDAHQFQLVYQPVVRIDDEAIVGAEVLLRWNHPERGTLPPGAFLPVLDGSRHALDVGYWVLEEACRRTQGWRGANGKGFRLSVNLFAAQLRDPRLVNRVRTILERTGFDGRDLELEITEDILLTPSRDLAAVIRELKMMGIAIVLDDFGTGYGSLTHLLQFSIDRLKVDRAFVRGLGESHDHNKVTQAVVKLAVDLGLKVTAEGIETDEQKHFLARIGCDDLQGFHFSRPVPVEQMEDLLARSHARISGETRDMRAGVA
ncbi:MAG: hypothetical protein CMN87_19200 [Stappia sp.]|uniref:sensor domain-containing phosphodiesterase n=1 Tax=Stappia sp. TaxID=1870903 RepID=UPI000C6804D5|nr:EAL domain-containing protein [Stappia sp.]MBM22134.1 hypothetical protein [Stappia sp.]